MTKLSLFQEEGDLVLEKFICGGRRLGKEGERKLQLGCKVNKKKNEKSVCVPQHINRVKQWSKRCRKGLVRVNILRCCFALGFDF